jgi:phage terminase large subunit-like protein
MAKNDRYRDNHFGQKTTFNPPTNFFTNFWGHLFGFENKVENNFRAGFETDLKNGLENGQSLDYEEILVPSFKTKNPNLNSNPSLNPKQIDFVDNNQNINDGGLEKEQPKLTKKPPKNLSDVLDKIEQAQAQDSQNQADSHNSVNPNLDYNFQNSPKLNLNQKTKPSSNLKKTEKNRVNQPKSKISKVKPCLQRSKIRQLFEKTGLEQASINHPALSPSSTSNLEPGQNTIANWLPEQIPAIKKDLQKLLTDPNPEIVNQTKLALQIALSNPENILLFALLVLPQWFNRPFNQHQIQTLQNFGFGHPSRQFAKKQDHIALKAYRGFGKTSLCFVLGTIFETLAVASGFGFGSKFIVVCSLTEQMSQEKISLVASQMFSNGFIQNVYGNPKKAFVPVDSSGLETEKLPKWLANLSRQGLKFISQSRSKLSLDAGFVPYANFGLQTQTSFENEQNLEEVIDIFAPINNYKGRANKNQVDLFASVRLQAISTGQNPRGMLFNGLRPQRIVCDDILDDVAVKNIERRKFALSWFKSALIPSLAIGGRIEIINTPLHPQDIIETIFAGKGQFSKGWKTQLVSALDKNRQSVDPNWKTTAELELLQADSGVFAREYLCMPVMQEEAMVKNNHLRYWLGSTNNQEKQMERFVKNGLAKGFENKLKPNLETDLKVDLQTDLQTPANYLPIITEGYLHADTTHTGNKTSDYFCAVYIGKGIDKNFYVVDFILEKLDVQTQAQKLIALYQKTLSKGFPINGLSYDEKANQGLLTWLPKLARQDYDLSLPLKPLGWLGNKQQHLQSHLAHFIAGRIYFPLHHPALETALDQLLNFPSKSVHDDFVDGLCGALDGFETANRAKAGQFINPKGQQNGFMPSF